jgi:hypothetical protein
MAWPSYRSEHSVHERRDRSSSKPSPSACCCPCGHHHSPCTPIVPDERSTPKPVVNEQRRDPPCHRSRHRDEVLRRTDECQKGSSGHRTHAKSGGHDQPSGVPTRTERIVANLDQLSECAAVDGGDEHSREAPEPASAANSDSHEFGPLQGRSGPFSRSALGGIRTPGGLIRSRPSSLQPGESGRTERIARR